MYTVAVQNTPFSEASLILHLKDPQANLIWSDAAGQREFAATNYSTATKLQISLGKTNVLSALVILLRSHLHVAAVAMNQRKFHHYETSGATRLSEHIATSGNLTTVIVPNSLCCLIFTGIAQS